MYCKPPVSLEGAISSLQDIVDKLDRILPGIAEGPLREDLLQMHYQAQAAVRYYNSVATPKPRKNVPEVAERVAQATLGMSGIGLLPRRS